MDIRNCFEAVVEMERLSLKLEDLFKKNAKTKKGFYGDEIHSPFDGGINAVEREFLAIKHSLDVITVKNHEESAYILALKIVSQNKTEKSEEYLTIKEALINTPYIKNMRYYI